MFLSNAFFQSCKHFPEEKALHIDGTYFTYTQLYQIVLSIYHKIPSNTKYQRIGIICNNDVYSYAAFIAVNAYGAAFVPINPSSPIDKYNQLIATSNLQLLLNASSTAPFTGTQAQVINIAATDLTDAALNTATKVVEQQLAYILCTSGSTGVPKAVPITNDNITALFQHFLKQFDFNQNDKFLQTFELTFDVAVFSFFMPLIVGACCYVLPPTAIKNLDILKAIDQYQITVLPMVSTTLSYWQKYIQQVKLSSLRYCILTADALQVAHLKPLQQKAINCLCYNFYGPTEATIFCSSYAIPNEIPAEDTANGILSIGKPFDNMAYLILDESQKVCEKGMLYIAGNQVIKAYLDNSHTDKFYTLNNQIYYNTGDIVARNTAGNLLFYGRADNQVKLNGYRIELSEIEFAIEQAFDTKAIVLKVGEEPYQKLVAFSTQPSVNISTLRNCLQKRLPAYMLPKEWIFVKEFPFNLNGKLDRNKLLQQVNKA